MGSMPGGEAGDQSASVFLVAGEASGDWAGGLLCRALHRRRPDLRLRGIGGQRMRSAGVELFADSSPWGAIGVFESLLKAPRVLRTLRDTRSLLAAQPPAALVLIDFGAFNVPLARFARRAGIRTLYHLPPGSWSRRARSRELSDLVDVITTPLPWSRDLLSGGRARVEWVGHPVLETAVPTLPRDDAWRRYDLDPAKPTVALAPGSRQQEMRYVLPVLARAGVLLARRFEGLQFLVPVAPTVDRSKVQSRLDRLGLRAVLLDGMDYDALQLASAAAVCSGTATLEFACLGIPMVVVYRASRATTLQYRLFRGLIQKQRLAAMPNILMDREIVRELLGSAASPEAISGELERLLGDADYCSQVKKDLAQAVTFLGKKGASDRAAELVLELMGASE